MHLTFRQHRRRFEYEESKNHPNLSYLYPVHLNNKYNGVPKKHFKISNNLLYHVSVLYDHKEQESALENKSKTDKKDSKQCKKNPYVYNSTKGNTLLQ